MNTIPNNATDVIQRANTIYDNDLRAVVETDENIGKMLILDIESGDYEIDDLGIKAAQRLKDRHRNPVLFGIRIGYDAAYSFGGVLTRRK